MAESRAPGPDAFEKRRVAPRASEPPVTAPSTRRRVLVWRAAPQPQATPLPGRRVEGRGSRANGDEVSAGKPRRFPEFPQSRVGRLALGVLVGALLALAGDVSATRGDVAATVASSPPTPAGGAVAFLFLTRGPGEGRKALPHDHLWSRFFKGQNKALFLVRTHAPPGFFFTDENTAAPEVFKGTEVINPVYPTVWGTVSIVKAEQALLRSALRSSKPKASAFVLLSESCIPIRAFPFTRAYLLDGVPSDDALSVVSGDDDARVSGVDEHHARKRNQRSVLLDRHTSFVESSPDRHARWPGFRDPDARAALPRKFWRKGSQWFALTRRHASVVAADVLVVEAFERYCSTDETEVIDTTHERNRTQTQTQNRGTFCAPDEHFVPTLLAINGHESQLVSRSVTYTNWWPIKRRHPKRFIAQETSVDFIRGIVNRIKTEDEFEGNVEGTTSCGWFASGERAGLRKPCFLFARKFTTKAGIRVGKFASVAIGY